jgi:hypothetical protein
MASSLVCTISHMINGAIAQTLVDPVHHPADSFTSMNPLLSNSDHGISGKHDQDNSERLRKPMSEVHTSLVLVPKRKIFALQSLNRWWVVEWLSCILAAVCQIGIILVARKYNHQPLPEWPRMISINSLVSVLGTASKAQMLISVASGMFVVVDCLWFLKA